jgi:diguanylate cyclase (GGDEF)-like protein
MLRPAQGERASPEYNSGVLPRILVADDDRTTIVLIVAALGDAFDVVVVSTGAEVLERAGKGDIDLVLLDVVMPDLDGFEVCRRLKDQPHGARIPVIFVTAREETADEAHGFAVGAVDYITKPIRPSVVRARVRTHVELKRTRDALEQLASVDPLTGIANRRRFDAAIHQEWRRSQRGSRWLSLALVDVDHFKQFNDRYGHLAGDERLRAIATSLVQSAQRAGELAARYGGEEFALVLPAVDPAMMQGIMRTLLTSVAGVRGAAATPGAHEIITISVGAITVLPPRDASETVALAAADTLLYEAKDRGRDCCVHQDLALQGKMVIHRAVR